MDYVREQFATAFWEPLFAWEDFAQRLQHIQAQVQGLLFSQVRIFHQELETFRQRFGPLLLSTPPPAFDPVQDCNRPDSSGYSSFQALYQWVVSGFRHAFEDRKRLHAGGIPWRTLHGSRRSWTEYVRQIEKALSTQEIHPEFTSLVALGQQIADLCAGFVTAPRTLTTYDDPKQSPDFEAIKQLFLQGLVVIRIERR